MLEPNDLIAIELRDLKRLRVPVGPPCYSSVASNHPFSADT